VYTPEAIGVLRDIVMDIIMAIIMATGMAIIVGLLPDTEPDTTRDSVMQLPIMCIITGQMEWPEPAKKAIIQKPDSS
jgi:hypothetical protein